MAQRLLQSRKLIIAAHPDDETFGVSSLLQNSTILLVTDSNNSNFISRKRVLSDICKAQNVRLIELKFEACKLDLIGISTLLDSFRDVLKSRDFDYIIAHSADDEHQDHKMIYHAAKLLARPERTNFKGFLTYNISQKSHTNGLIIKANEKLLEQYKPLVDRGFYNSIIAHKKYIGACHNVEFADIFGIEYIR